MPEVAPGVGAGTAVQDMRDISVAGGKVYPQIDDPKDVHSKQGHLELPVTLSPVVFSSDEASLEAKVPVFLPQRGARLKCRNMDHAVVQKTLNPKPLNPKP